MHVFYGGSKIVRWQQSLDSPPAFSRKSRAAPARSNEDSTSSTPVAVVMLDFGSLHVKQRTLNVDLAAGKSACRSVK